jgi:hypothetical protein
MIAIILRGKYWASMRDLTPVGCPLESASRDRPDSNKPDTSGSSSDGEPPLRTFGICELSRFQRGWRWGYPRRYVWRHVFQHIPAFCFVLFLSFLGLFAWQNVVQPFRQKRPQNRILVYAFRSIGHTESIYWLRLVSAEKFLTGIVAHQIAIFKKSSNQSLPMSVSHGFRIGSWYPPVEYNPPIGVWRDGNTMAHLHYRYAAFINEPRHMLIFARPVPVKQFNIEIQRRPLPTVMKKQDNAFFIIWRRSRSQLAQLSVLVARAYDRGSACVELFLQRESLEIGDYNQEICENRYRNGRKKRHEPVVLVRQTNPPNHLASDIGNYGPEREQAQYSDQPSDAHYLLGFDIAVFGVVVLILGVTAATGGSPSIPECLRLAIGVLLVLCGYGLAVWGMGIFFRFPPFKGEHLFGKELVAVIKSRIFREYELRTLIIDVCGRPIAAPNCYMESLKFIVVCDESIEPKPIGSRGSADFLNYALFQVFYDARTGFLASEHRKVRRIFGGLRSGGIVQTGWRVRAEHQHRFTCFNMGSRLPDISEPIRHGYWFSSRKIESDIIKLNTSTLGQNQRSSTCFSTFLGRIRSLASFDQSLIRNPRLFLDSSPLHPSEETVHNADDQQPLLNTQRCEPRFVFGACLFCGSFFLMGYGVKRLDDRSIQGGLIVSVSAVGTYSGGCLMFFGTWW